MNITDEIILIKIKQKNKRKSYPYTIILVNVLLTSVSKSDEESVEEDGEPVSKVLNDIDPPFSLFLTNSILAFTGCSKPRGHPSS